MKPSCGAFDGGGPKWEGSRKECKAAARMEPRRKEKMVEISIARAMWMHLQLLSVAEI